MKIRCTSMSLLLDGHLREERKVFEKQVKELMEYYGLERNIAQEIAANYKQSDVEAILNFYASYGKLIKLK